MLRLSVVVTTRNEAENIASCIRAFDSVVAQGLAEVIVVDNASTDDTKQIAKSLNAKVFDKGPERCAQRNYGWRQAAGDWVLVLDADMILPPETINEILSVEDGDAFWIPEVRSGSGFRTKVRNFERSFYDGTCIDALRLFRKDILNKTGGYDESLLAGGEDWELDIRILEQGAKCALLKNHLIHNEQQLSLSRLMAKKAYYAKGFARYKEKWPNHRAVKMQFSPVYRFIGVFTENGKWRKVLRHPILFLGVVFERILVGIIYLIHR